MEEYFKILEECKNLCIKMFNNNKDYFKCMYACCEIVELHGIYDRGATKNLYNALLDDCEAQFDSWVGIEEEEEECDPIYEETGNMPCDTYGYCDSHCSNFFKCH